MVAKSLDEIQEKALSQRSAGVDAAIARRVDRPGVAAEDADREAARALRSGMGRRKIRKKARPFAQRAWVRAIGLGLLLLGLFAIFYFMTRPPSEEKLYEQTKAAVHDRDEDRVIATSQRFLDIYPKANDSQARDIRIWREQSWTSKREKQLFNRFERKLSPEDEGQRLSASAMRYENDGDVENAQRMWREMEEQFKEAPVPEPAVYAWVARKKLSDLADIDPRVEQVLQFANDWRMGRDRDRKPESEAEHLSIEAIRYDSFGDTPEARDRWAKIRDQFLKPLDVRLWGIMAAQRASQLKSRAVNGAEKERAFRLQLLAQRWTQVDPVTPHSDPAERRNAAAVCRDMIDLYGHDPDPEIADYARKAERKLRDLGV
jgi:hypothetical protein